MKTCAQLIMLLVVAAMSSGCFGGAYLGKKAREHWDKRPSNIEQPSASPAPKTPPAQENNKAPDGSK